MAPRTTTDPLEILLEMGIDLDNLSDEEDYLSALMEATNALTIKSASDPRIPILQKEILKVRKKRKAADPTFKARKTKISANSFKKKTSSVKALPGTSKGGSLVVKKTKISAEDIKSNEDKNILESILGSVTNISDMLREQYKLEEKNAEKDRKSTEKTKRKLQESGLEKAFKGLAKTTQKVIAPVKSLLDKIFGFITTVLLARFLNKFIDWFSDPDNRSKVQSIIRFLGDHWKKLITLYLVFGTGLGRFIVGLTKTLIGGALKLGIAIAKLLAAKKLKGARGVARFLGKRGRLIKGIGTALVVGGTYAGVNSLTSSGEEKQTQGFSGGGLAKPPKVEPLPKNAERNQGMSGAQKGMAFGSLFGPLGMAAGAGIGSLFDNFGNKKDDTVKLSSPAKVELEVPSGTEGEVDGPGGIDKVPAMLTDGEFVMSRGAVQKYGVGQLEAMNASGGGTNKPKIMNNMVYASGGGRIGRGSGAGSPPGGYSSGSLTSDPLGALDRMLGQSSGGRVRIPGGGGQDSKPSNSPSKSSSPPPKPRVQPKDPVIPSSSNKPPSSSNQETSRDQKAGGIPERMLKSPTFRDSGLLYLRSMLGGLGGPITESQLSKASRVELNNAIARAKQRTGSELEFAEKQLKEAKDGGFNKQILAERQSVYDRLKRGEVRVLYQDYYDGNDEKNITPAAENAKSILGKFWATSTERGGFKVVNEKYDFVDMPDPMAVLRGDSSGVSKGAKAGEDITLRQKLQALHQLNPFAKEMSVDMILGEKPNPKRDIGNIMKYTMGGMADAVTGNLFDFDNQGGTSLRNPSGKKEEEAREKVDKQLSTLQGMSKKQVLNSQKYAASKGKYFSSSDGKTYESYQAAVDAKKARLASNKPNVSIPAPPPKPAPKVVVANTGSGRDGSFGAGTSGKGRPSDDVNAANPGNGNKAKWSILGIPVPFT